MRRKKTLEERQEEMRAREADKRGLGIDYDHELVRHARAKLVGFLLHKKGRSADVIAGHLKRLFGLDVRAELVEEWIAKGCPLAPIRGVGSYPSFPAA